MSYNHIWAEINLKKIANNIKNLRALVAPETSFMAVVKANGYGHGSVEVSKVALENGADSLGVARINEAIKIRKAGIDCPLLVLGFTDPSDTDKLLEYDLSQTVYSEEIAKKYSEIALETAKKLKVHIKVDTGMGRLGIVVSQDLDFMDKIRSIVSETGLETEGIYTHFASSDSFDKTSASKQLFLYNQLLKELESNDIYIPVKHAANSAAIMELKESHFDMVRCGISMYGLYPSDEVNKNTALEPAMELKCRVVQTKRVPKDFCVSYGSTYKTKSETTLVTIPVGYADGLNRIFSSKGFMLHRGKKVAIAGRVCMDQTVLDVGDMNITQGDEIVIFGEQLGNCISIDEIAKELDTINYEVVTTIMERVPRVYVQGTSNNYDFG
ncbi:MAG: alanine racemase [Desulfobacterales bacterium]|nr:alanine racemase [Desulfobacterales bacterium]MCP4163771.1 alanine racemase [Deltaproteobacteria bacterium]